MCFSSRLQVVLFFVCVNRLSCVSVVCDCLSVFFECFVCVFVFACVCLFVVGVCSSPHRCVRLI